MTGIICRLLLRSGYGYFCQGRKQLNNCSTPPSRRVHTEQLQGERFAKGSTHILTWNMEALYSKSIVLRQGAPLLHPVLISVSSGQFLPFRVFATTTSLVRVSIPPTPSIPAGSHVTLHSLQSLHSLTTQSISTTKGTVDTRKN